MSFLHWPGHIKLRCDGCGVATVPQTAAEYVDGPPLGWVEEDGPGGPHWCPECAIVGIGDSTMVEGEE